MSLEDGIPDVVEKAMTGLGVVARKLAERSGVDVARIEAILDGASDDSSLRKIAPVLDLRAEALIALPGYVPERLELAGVQRLILPFGEWTVNAWMVQQSGISLLFDTGCNCGDITTALRGRTPDAAFITHDHQDHVGGISALGDLGIRVISATEALESSMFRFGSVSVHSVDLSGHKTPTAGYFIEGLGRRILVAGDAIFAGSMGRCRSTDAYRTALVNLRRVLQEAGGDCVILPGHGPATTVAEELASNPFL